MALRSWSCSATRGSRFTSRHRSAASKEHQAAGCTCVTEGPDGGGTVEGADLLVGVGRTPNTGGIGLERAGVKLTETGYIAVDERLATTAAGVWAMGECAGGPQFTPVAFDDFRVVHDNLNGGSRTTRDRRVVNSDAQPRQEPVDLVACL